MLWKRVGGAKKRKAIGSGHVADLQAIRDKDRQREQLIDTVYNSQVYRSRRDATSVAKKPASAATPMPTVVEGVAMTDTMAAADDGGKSSTSSSSSTSSASACDDAPMATLTPSAVVIDEASQVDDSMVQKINYAITQLPQRPSVCVAADYFQLPPVGVTQDAPNADAAMPGAPTND